MTTPRKPSALFSDIEMAHPTAAEPLGDAEAPPVTVRLADLWSDFVRAAEESREEDGRRKSGSVVPILDEMKGILQWD
jgi:hypothetical protein